MGHLEQQEKFEADAPKLIAYQDESSRRFNRAYRRRMKKALKMPFTPSQEFAEAMTEKIKREAPQQAKGDEPVKVRVPRAFEKDEIDDTTTERQVEDVGYLSGRDAGTYGSEVRADSE